MLQEPVGRVKGGARGWRQELQAARDLFWELCLLETPGETVPEPTFFDNRKRRYLEWDVIRPSLRVGRCNRQVLMGQEIACI